MPRPETIESHFTLHHPTSFSLMLPRRAFLFQIGFGVFAFLAMHAAPSLADDRPPVRVAVIGGMTMTGMWEKLAAQFEADTGWKTQLVIPGAKDALCAHFRRAQV